jgi:hypothetical protein
LESGPPGSQRKLPLFERDFCRENRALPARISITCRLGFNPHDKLISELISHRSGGCVAIIRWPSLRKETQSKARSAPVQWTNGSSCFVPPPSHAKWSLACFVGKLLQVSLACRPTNWRIAPTIIEYVHDLSSCVGAILGLGVGERLTAWRRIGSLPDTSDRTATRSRPEGFRNQHDDARSTYGKRRKANQTVDHYRRQCRAYRSFFVIDG